MSTNFQANLMGRFQGEPPVVAKAQQFKSNTPSEKAIIREAEAVVEMLKKSVREIKYRKTDGTLTDMTVTLLPIHIPATTSNGGKAPTLKPGQFFAWSIDRKGWRNLNVQSIEEMSAPVSVPTITGTKVTTANITAASVQHPGVSFNLTSAQQTALFFWITGVVHRELTNKNKPKDVSIELAYNSVGTLTVLEKNTGLTVDL